MKSQLFGNRARDLFVKEHATRYTELSRLPYFNIVEQVVIDPMHNLFLGLVKTHFYHIWIQMGILRENHELRVLHEMLRDFVVPTSAGKLPKDIGTPAGGSLTADQWRLLAVVEGPIVIPQLWASCLPNDPTKLLNDRVERIAREELQKLEEKRRAAAERARKKAEKDTAQKKPSKSVMNTGEVYSLHPDDPANFLKLSEALRLLTSHVLTTAEIKDADKLLREYCTELLRLYGKGAIRPNHHYATHVPDFALMFGPLHNFWSFLFERLNKVLKSYNTNNRGDGELETTFFTEFHRTSASARMVSP
ncbi:hypothetical protein LXA43DRAFT_977257 [Ganoderma leucocontextum]|nr:hypothetical protein LXA43DRAFT_977257 [Ganoderma leucocontextum]